MSEPTIDGYTEIKYEKDLEIDELEVIRSLSSVNTRIPKMQYSLRTTFPTRMRLYDSQLLHRVSNKYQDDKYGQDRHRMSLFMEMGNNVKDGGGKFETDVNSTYQLVGTRFQTSRQSNYAKQYGSYYTQVDGTYGTNKYGMTICPFIAICCLGYTHMIGCSTGLSENSVDITKAAHCFGVSSVERDIDVSSLFDPPYHSHHDVISH